MELMPDLAPAAGTAGALFDWSTLCMTVVAAVLGLVVWRMRLRLKHAMAAMLATEEALRAIERGDTPSPIQFIACPEMASQLESIHRMARRLDARGRHMRAIIQSEPECVKTLDKNGDLLDMNPAGLRMIEADSIEEVRGVSVFDLVHPDWLERFQEMHRAVIGGESRTLIFELIGLKGTHRWMETQAVPLRNSDGHIAHLAITRDITVRKIQESELMLAKEKAEAANRFKTEFLANMSHELRTPLTAILGYADLLNQPGNTPEEQQFGLATISASANHLVAIISDILDISKIEANMVELETLTCDLTSIVHEVVDSMQAYAAEQKIELVVEIESPLPLRFQSDPMRLRQILSNLVSNAIKFTDEGEVRIRLRATSSASGASGPYSRVEVAVIDSGVGIATEHLSRIFLPFTQADKSTTRRFGGTGLGLCISLRLAQMLGGEILVESEVGRGSVFTLILDLRSAAGEAQPGDELPEPKAPLPSPPPATSEAPPRLEGRVLLVEDSPVNRRVLRKRLERLGLEVHEAEDGREGFERAMQSVREAEPFDLVLLDMNMPVMDGYTAASMLREEHFPSPVIAITASAMPSDRAHCRASGCDDYISKPVKQETLRTLLARHLDPQASRPST